MKTGLPLQNNEKLTALLCLKSKRAVILGENMQNKIKILPLVTMLALAACAVQSQGIYNSGSGFIPSISRSIEREL
ncbi:hypothetical protein JFL47_13860 [Haemophilus haemoglobinophilus]|nr:hypothetical protein [Canicola haemoglobinophilus]MBN6712281.1 hypothetical protein [Canicola haemoglobinophilus]